MAASPSRLFLAPAPALVAGGVDNPDAGGNPEAGGNPDKPTTLPTRDDDGADGGGMGHDSIEDEKMPLEATETPLRCESWLARLAVRGEGRMREG